MKASTKLLSVLLILAMCLSLVSITAFASGPIVIYIDDAPLPEEEEPAVGEEPSEEPVEVQDPEEEAPETEEPGEEPAEENPADEPVEVVPSEPAHDEDEDEELQDENTVAIIRVKGQDPIEKGSLPEALEAAPEGAVVKLVKSVELGASLTLSKSVSLDLGGNSLSISGSGAAAVIAASGAQVSISNGSLLLSGAEGIVAAADASVALYGLRVSMSGDAPLFGKSEGSISAMSGSYSQDPTDYMPEGYLMTQVRNGSFTVFTLLGSEDLEEKQDEEEDKDKPKSDKGDGTKAAYIGDTPYDTLQAAINAAVSGDVIELDKDVNESDINAPASSKSMTINLCGHKLTLANPAVFSGEGMKLMSGTVEGSINVTGGSFELNGVTINGAVSISSVDSRASIIVSDKNVTINGLLSIDLSDKININISGGNFKGGLNVVAGIGRLAGATGGLFFYTESTKTDVENALKAIAAPGREIRDMGTYFTFASLPLKIVSSDGKTVYYDSNDTSISNHVSFYKGSSSNSDFVFKLDCDQSWEKSSVQVYDEDDNLKRTLTSGDYSISGKTLTIKASSSYLKSLPAGVCYFNFVLTDGSVKTGEAQINLYVYASYTSDTQRRYVKKSGTNLTVGLTDPCISVGRALTTEDINKGNYTLLTSGTDYTRSGNKIILLSSYLDQRCNDDAEITEVYAFIYKIGSYDVAVPLTVTLVPAPTVLPNPLVDNWTWKRGTDKSFTVKPDIISVTIDSTPINAGLFTVKDTNTLTLKKDAMDGFGYGNHTLKVMTKDGEAKATITLAPSLGYKVSNQHTKGGSKTLTYVASDQILEVKVGEQVLVAGYDYMLEKDLKTFTITAEFLNKLDADKTYTISAIVRDSAGNQYTVTSTIKTLSSGAAGSNPKTGDESHIGLWIAALMLSGAAVVVLIPRRKKQ